MKGRRWLLIVLSRKRTALSITDAFSASPVGNVLVVQAQGSACCARVCWLGTDAHDLEQARSISAAAPGGMGSPTGP